MSIIEALDGYILTIIFYSSCYWLCSFPARKHLRVPCYALALLALVHSLVVVFALHMFWAAAVFVLFPFFWLLCKAIDVEPYKLMYIMMVAMTYTILCNLVYYILFGCSYAWGWLETGWILLGIGTTLPPMTLLVHRVIWPQLEKLHLPNPKWLVVVPALVIAINLLLATSYVQYLAAGGYEWIYTLTMFIVLVGTVALGLLILVIMGKMQDALNCKNDLRIIDLQMASQRRHYAEVMQYASDIRVIRHDLRYHLRMVNSLLGSGKTEELKAYLSEYEKCTHLNEGIAYSRNCASEMVATHMAYAAREASIDVTIKCRLPEALWIADSDLCVLLGNLAENALNACRLQTEGPRRIRYTTAVHGAEVLIRMENTCGAASLDTPAHRKAAGVVQGNGYGMTSIKTVAAKYRGTALFERQENQYTVSVLLYQPEAKAAPVETPQLQMTLEAPNVATS